MQPGDTLLMVTKPSFMQRHRLQEHFALISQVTLRPEWNGGCFVIALVDTADASSYFLPPSAHQVDGQRNFRRNKAPLAIFFTVAMIALSVSEVLDLLTAALLAIAGLMITRCLTSSEVGLV
jgi:hypothetical protein